MMMLVIYLERKKEIKYILLSYCRAFGPLGRALGVEEGS